MSTLDRRQFLGTLGAATLVACESTPPSKPTPPTRKAAPDAAAPRPDARPAVDAAPPAPPVVHEVRMFRGNPTHTFYGTGPVGDRLAIRWKKRLGKFVSPAAANREAKTWEGTGWTGTAVYVADRVYVGSLDSFMYAFEPETGKTIWRYKAGGMFKSSCAFHDGRLFCGNVDNYLHCVDAATGKPVWRFDTQHDLDSSPCIADGLLYVGGENGFLHCLDPATGKVVWKTFLGGLNGPLGSCGVESSPAVHDGKVFASTFDGWLFACDVKDGKVVWKARTRGDTDVSPVVALGRVFTAAEEEAPFLYSFEEATGKEVWKLSNHLGWWSTPAVVGDRLYVGSQNNRFLCLEALTGKLVWEHRTTAPIWSSAAVVDGKVIFGGYDNHVTMLAAADGHLISRVNLGGRVISSPCVVRGNIYVGTATGFFCALTTA
jgi:outer membrane protein assembly factor BamB